MFGLLSRTDQILQHIDGGRILDVGCTGGAHNQEVPSNLHVELCKRFDDVTGIDVNETNIALMKSKCYENVFLEDAESFSFSEPFDVIVAGELIEHLTNPAAFLLNCKKHLHKGGRIVLTTPYPFAMLHVLFSLAHYPKTCSHSEHTLWLCPSTIRELAKRCGLAVSHMSLIDNYIKNGPTMAYRVLVRFLSIFRCVIPRRLRCNSLLVLLEVFDDDATCSSC